MHGFNHFKHGSKVIFMCCFVVISSMAHGMSAFGETNEPFEEFILASTPAITSFNQDDTTFQAAQMWFAKGEAAERNGNYGEAIKCYNKAIKLDPNYAKAYYFLGISYYIGKKDYDKAIKLL